MAERMTDDSGLGLDLGLGVLDGSQPGSRRGLQSPTHACQTALTIAPANRPGGTEHSVACLFANVICPYLGLDGDRLITTVHLSASELWLPGRSVSIPNGALC